MVFFRESAATRTDKMKEEDSHKHNIAVSLQYAKLDSFIMILWAKSVNQLRRPYFIQQECEYTSRATDTNILKQLTSSQASAKKHFSSFSATRTFHHCILPFHPSFHTLHPLLLQTLAYNFAVLILSFLHHLQLQHPLM